ncbi:MAG: hypothetical protein A2096_09040 [Spirochaetes bacterium GWF1_41_5]|nr:MAG: hypothetical protein A2096_09040 [Spirochaetes bacterium GWF1_41_5]HBE02494.1 hypothetical protein [Spirochaetia bacterium]
MNRPLIVILDNRYLSYDTEKNILAPLNPELIFEKSLDQNDIIRAAENADAVLVNLAVLDRPVIKRLKKCRCISRYGIGYDNVDLEAASESKIILANVPDYCIEEASDHTLALLLSAVRGIPARDSGVRNGQWNIITPVPVRRLSGSILGLAGFGKIARAVVRKTAGWNFREILCHDPFVSQDIMNAAGVKSAAFCDLLEQSDFLTIHIPLNSKTVHFFGSREFSLMKKNAFIINTARGKIIDQGALLNALRSGHLSGAALDVYEEEPPLSDLLRLPNVVLSDHAAWYSQESVLELKARAAQNIVDVLVSGSTANRVNL